MGLIAPSQHVKYFVNQCVQMNKTEVSVSNGGCITTIIALIILWALLFGVNYNGKHYGISCGPTGVNVDLGSSR